jgi:hypothetical protein
MSETKKGIGNMSSRRIVVFFYGLFMDADLLRTKGAHPIKIRTAGRKGGSRNTAAQRAARRRNGQLHGFQRVKPTPEIETHDFCNICADKILPANPVIVPAQKPEAKS